MASGGNLCQMCKKQPQKYSCPRCNLLYCSVDCYRAKDHLKCSEEFYQECVMQEMALRGQAKSGTLDDIPGLSDDIKRMYQILKRMESVQSTGSNISDFDISDEEELDSDDEAPETDLTNRLEGINLDDADAIWAQLTAGERKEFEAIVESNDIANIIPTYAPWWEQKSKKPLVEDMPSTSEAAAGPNQITEHPPIHSAIADFAQISTKPPAACIKFNLTNVLAAYASVVRFFNGDHLETPHEAASYLISICANLKTNANFEEQTPAIDSVCYEAHNEGFSNDHIDMDVIKRDIDFIAEGPDPSKPCNTYILAALSDIHHLVKAAKAERKVRADGAGKITGTGVDFEEFVKRFGDHKVADAQIIDKTKLNACIKKMEFYLAFVKKFR